MRRWVWIVLLAAVGCLVLGANEPKVDVNGERVRIEPGNLEGTLALSTIPIRTEMDTRIIDLKHILRITLQPEPNAEAQDSIQLVNKEIIRGRVLEKEFVVSSGGQLRVMSRGDIEQITILREEDLSLFSILVGLLTLTAMEIVLGIDNVIFLAIVAGRLPEKDQPRARRIGLAAALGTRLLLLFTLSFLLGLTRPVFTLPDLPFLHDLEAREISARDIILLLGGAFLIGKSAIEIQEKLEHARSDSNDAIKPTSFVRAIVTIAVIDIVFSLDSVITAVGMVEHLWVMVTAMVIAMFVMLWFSGPISRFVEKHPTVKVLALAFLILIGVMLLAEGLGQHINKGYIYFAMAFAVGVEMVNMRLRRRHTSAAPVPAAAVPSA